jgi:hypothetical protein
MGATYRGERRLHRTKHVASPSGHGTTLRCRRSTENAGSPRGPVPPLLGTRIEIEDGSGVVGRLERRALGAGTTSGKDAPPGLRPGRGAAVGVLIGTDTDFDHDHWPGDNTRRTPSAASPRPLGDSLPWGLSECPAWNTISDMSYIPAIAVFDDGSRVRPIPIEDEERVAPGDSWLGDRADRQARKRPWVFIGRRLVEGIPGIRITRR